MNWILIAVIGHLSNAVAFIVDKTLLDTAFKRSSTYAALVGALSLLVLVATPWVKAWPAGLALGYAIAFGGLFPLALWLFFEALSRAEASRVVPVVGSLIPIFTFFGTFMFLNERLSWSQTAGFVLLIGATVLLTGVGKRGKRIDGQTVLLAVLSAMFYAAASVAGKIAYAQSDFLGVFVFSRTVAGIVGVLIGLLYAPARHELSQLLRATGPKRAASGLAVFGQICGASGFVLLNVALAGGSAAVVNALQAVQYAGIVLVAWFGGSRLRALLKEERTTTIMIVKGLAIVLTAAGLALVT